MVVRQPSRRAAQAAAAEAAATATAAEGDGGGGGGGGAAKRLWSKPGASLALAARVKPPGSRAVPKEITPTTPRLAELREQRTMYDLFAGIDKQSDNTEDERPQSHSSALLAQFSLPAECRLAQLELSPGFAPLRRGSRRGKSSAQAEAASLEVLASEQRESSERLQRVVRSTSRSLLDEGISMGEMYASKQVCC